MPLPQSEIPTFRPAMWLEETQPGNKSVILGKLDTDDKYGATILEVKLRCRSRIRTRICLFLEKTLASQGESKNNKIPTHRIDEPRFYLI